MYCTRCGAEIEQTTAGDFVCAKTGAYLSGALAVSLTECFVESKRAPASEPLSFATGGAWYCPACGVSMTVGPHVVSCPQCRLCLNEFVYPLTEFNPHP